MSGIPVPGEGGVKRMMSPRRSSALPITASIMPSPPSVLPLCIKQKAPDFKGIAVVNEQFKTISLSDYKGQYLVLFFYPLDFTFVCPTEILAFSDRVIDFKKNSTAVVGCSTDSHFSHLQWINTPRSEGGIEGLQFPLLSDKSMKISQNYGILDEESGTAFRGTFIIDPQGILRHISINDLGVGRNIDEVLRLIEALKFTDEHGEVCPVNWKPGGKTIVPDTDKSKEYFQSVNT